LSCGKELKEKMKKKLEAFSSSKCREFTQTAVTDEFKLLTEDTSFVSTFFDWGEMG
jgi:hypothetical protein